MTPQEMIQLMRTCSLEISSLRKKNWELHTKAKAYDNLVLVLNLLPKKEGTGSFDLNQTLFNQIEQLESSLKKKKKTLK